MHSGNASTPGELLEQHRLALHHRHRCLGTDVAKPEDGGAVGDDRDRVALDRQRPRLGRILVNRHTHTRYPGRVGHRKIVAGLDRYFRVDLDLAALVHQERAVRHAVDTDALQLAHHPHDRLSVSGIHARDRHVADGLLGLHPHEVDRAEHRLGVCDRASDPGERTALLRHVQAHREAIGGRGLQPQGRYVREFVRHGSSFVQSRTFAARWPRERSGRDVCSSDRCGRPPARRRTARLSSSQPAQQADVRVIGCKTHHGEWLDPDGTRPGCDPFEQDAIDG